MEVQFIPLLAVAPAIACAGTERHVTVVFGCACALIALVPFGGEPAALGERIGTASAVVAVMVASCFAVLRRSQMRRAFDGVRQIAEVTQRVLLRPIPERVGPVATGVAYLSAATDARVGGDFYEVIDTPYGVRAILGDMRGNGLDAVSGAAAVLGAFREAGAVEPTLEAVAVRLDAALARHTAAARRASGRGAGELATGAEATARTEGAGDRAILGEVTARTEDEGQLWIEDFATAVLVQVPYERSREQMRHGGVGAGGCGAGAGGTEIGGAGENAGGDRRAGTDVELWHGIGANEARLVVCGHPAPYLIRGDRTLPIEPERPTLPLGLGSLVDEPYAALSSVVPFEPGDALVFYTDGVCDARARSGEFFGLEELLCEIAGFGPGGQDSSEQPERDDFDGLAPRSVATIVRSRLLEHMRRELNDDAALLVLGRLGSA